jgi:hypothetical protein
MIFPCIGEHGIEPEDGAFQPVENDREHSNREIKMEASFEPGCL